VLTFQELDPAVASTSRDVEKTHKLEEVSCWAGKLGTQVLGVLVLRTHVGVCSITCILGRVRPACVVAR
jgi:hypothetical protein